MRSDDNEEMLARALKNRETLFTFSGGRPENLLREVLRKDPRLIASFSSYQCRISKGKGLLSPSSCTFRFEYDPDLPPYSQIVLDDGCWTLSRALRSEPPRKLYVIATGDPASLAQRLKGDLSAISEACPEFREWKATRLSSRLSPVTAFWIRCEYAIAPQQKSNMDQMAVREADRILSRVFAADRPFIRSMPDEVKAYFPYSYLQRNVNFVEQPEDRSDPAYQAEADTLYGVLCHWKGSAVGLAHAYMALASRLRLECRLVQGHAGTGDDWPSHTWCLVKIGGTFHHLDPSFGINGESVCTDGFLKSDREMKSTHQWDPLQAPECPLRSPSYYEAARFIQDHYDELLSSGAEEDIFSPDMVDW